MVSKPENWSDLAWRSPGHCWASGAKSGLLEKSMSLLLTPLKKKKESGLHSQYGFYSLVSTVKVNSSKVCQFLMILRHLLNKIYCAKIHCNCAKFHLNCANFHWRFSRIFGTAIVSTFIDIVPFLINIVLTYNLILWQYPNIARIVKAVFHKRSGKSSW